MTRFFHFIIPIVSIITLLTGCQVELAVQLTPSFVPLSPTETNPPPTPMPTDQPTATLTPTSAAGLPTREPEEQHAGLPQVKEAQMPAACEEPYCLYPADWPFAAPATLPEGTFADPTYLFGSTQNGQREMHLGVEFQQAHGSPVLAAAPGEVIVAGDDSQVVFGLYKNFYGNLVVIEHEIDHGEGPVYTLYAHLDEVLAAPGDRVERGAQIGSVGASGAATGSHLHFEVRVGTNEPGSAVNPLLFLAPPDGISEGVGQIVGSVIDAHGEPVTQRDIVLQPLETGPDAPTRSQYLQTYAPGAASTGRWQENFVSPFLSPGLYRLTLVHEGQLYEMVLPAEPGMFTYLHLQLGD